MTALLRALPRRLSWIFKTFPATIIISIVIMVVASITAGNSFHDHRILVDDVGLDLRKVLDWQLWTLPASTVIQAQPGIGPKLAVLIVVSLAALEYIVGSWRAAVTFFLSDWISAPLTILVAWPLAHVGIDRAYNVLYRPDTGSSAAALGALAAALTFLPRRWFIVSASVLFTILVCLLPTPDLSANIAHVLGAITGLGFGSLWRLHLTDRQWPVDSVSELFAHRCRPQLTARHRRDKSTDPAAHDD